MLYSFEAGLFSLEKEELRSYEKILLPSSQTPNAQGSKVMNNHVRYALRKLKVRTTKKKEGASRMPSSRQNKDQLLAKSGNWLREILM